MKSTAPVEISSSEPGSDKQMGEVCRQHHMSEKTYFRLQRKYQGLDIAEALRLESRRSPLARNVEEFLIVCFGEERAIELKTSLGKLWKDARVLSSPIGWFGLVLRPILIFFGIRAFWYFQTGLIHIEKRRFNWSLPPDEEKIAKKIVQNLENDGIACWPGLFSDRKILESAQVDSRTLIQKAYKILENFPGGMGDLRDAETGHRFLRNDPLKDMGRTRVRLDGWSGDVSDKKLPVWIQAVQREQRFLHVVKNRFGVEVELKRCSIDESIPSHYPVAWHLDTVLDSVKAMILLTDCEPDNGPMQYRIGSHKLKTVPIKQTYFYMFKHGDPYEYPGHAIWYKAPGEIKLATGKAGDCYFFETRGLHATLPCSTGKRVVCFVTLTVQSFRNKILNSIKAM